MPRRVSRSLIVTTAAVVIAASGAHAQSGRVDVMAIDASNFPRIAATTRVFLANGERAETLDGASVRVIEDGKDVKGSVSKVTVTGGLAWLFMVDRSGSMKTALPSVSAALKSFGRAVAGSDRSSVVAFDAVPEVLHAFSADRTSIDDSLAGLTASGATTELYYSLVTALPQFGAPGLPSERVVVVVSDGKDEGHAYTLDDVVEKMRAARVSVAAIGVTSGDRSHLLNLKRLAEKTGGVYFDGGQSEADWTEKVDLVRRQMSSLQRVEWTSGLPNDGISRQLKIELNHNASVMSAAVEVVPPFVPVPIWKRRSIQVATGGTLVVGLVIGGLVFRNRKQHRVKIQSLESELEGERQLRSAAQEAISRGLDEVKGKIDGIGARPAPGQRKLSESDKRRTVFMPGGGSRVAPAPPPYAVVTLEALDGPFAGARLPLPTGRTLVGRDPANQVVLVDDRASGNHAVLMFQSSQLTIEDVGSTNGTFVNDQRLTGPQILRSGDTVRCGNSSFRIAAGE